MMMEYLKKCRSSFHMASNFGGVKEPPRKTSHESKTKDQEHRISNTGKIRLFL